MSKVAVIGTGKMGGALVRGMVKGGFNPEGIGIIDEIKEKVDALQKELRVKSIGANELSNFSVVIVAVKPQDMKVALKKYNSFIKRDSLLLSIAAGVRLNSIKEWMGRNDIYYARAMPNVGAMVGHSITAILFEEGVREELKRVTMDVFKSVGSVYVVDREDLIDAHTCMGGSAPAIVAVFLRALEDSGVLLGLKREDASKVAIEVAKAVVRLKEEGFNFEEIKDMVASPGGTTIEALKYLERKGLRGLVMEAFGKALDKAKKLGG